MASKTQLESFVEQMEKRDKEWDLAMEELKMQQSGASSDMHQMALDLKALEALRISHMERLEMQTATIEDLELRLSAGPSAAEVKEVETLKPVVEEQAECIKQLQLRVAELEEEMRAQEDAEPGTKRLKKRITTLEKGLRDCMKEWDASKQELLKATDQLRALQEAAQMSQEEVLQLQVSWAAEHKECNQLQEGLNLALAEVSQLKASNEQLAEAFQSLLGEQTCQCCGGNPQGWTCKSCRSLLSKEERHQYSLMVTFNKSCRAKDTHREVSEAE